jgi:hypothetical protein
MTAMDEPNTDQIAAEDIDAWTARFSREPVGQVPVDLVCLIDQGEAGAIDKSSGVETIRRKGRLGQTIVVDPANCEGSWGAALTGAFSQVTAPLFVLTSVSAEWNRDILERLLKSIDFCDLAIGARPCESSLGRFMRTASSFGRATFWGAGVIDPLTPYKLGRSEILNKFPLQSASRFSEVEFIAKANFLDTLIHEEVMPVASPFATPRFGAGARADRRALFHHPKFRFETDHSVQIEHVSEPVA